MSAPAVAGPDSIQSSPEGENQMDQQQEIAQLAYSLWQQRGCPEGSASQDWIEAEERLRNPLHSIVTAS